MDERLKDFIYEMTGITRGAEKPDLDEITAGWEAYFRKAGIVGYEAQKKEFTEIMQARLQVGAVSIWPEQ